MSGNFKDFIKTPKGKLVCAVCVLAVTWTVLLFNFLGGAKDLIPSADKIKNAERDLKRKRVAYEEAIKEKAAADDVQGIAVFFVFKKQMSFLTKLIHFLHPSASYYNGKKENFCPIL